MDKWTVAYRIVMSGGNPRVGELRIFPSEPDFADRPAGEWSGRWKGVEATAPRRGLTTGVVRSIKVHRWLEQVREIVGAAKAELKPPQVAALREADETIVVDGGSNVVPESASTGPSAEDLFERFSLSGLLPKPALKPNRGRHRKPEIFYARIAEEYVAAHKKHLRPVQSIATKHHQSPAVVRGWVHRARNYGFLGGRKQGVEFGELTDKAMLILGAMKRPRRARKATGKQTRRRRR